MKQLPAILLLAVFFLFQGGRVLLYLECRISNSIASSSCDCNKILTDNKADTANDALPGNHHGNHKHLPEEFDVMAVSATNHASIISSDTYIHNWILLQEDFASGVFHPPIA